MKYLIFILLLIIASCGQPQINDPWNETQHFYLSCLPIFDRYNNFISVECYDTNRQAFICNTKTIAIEEDGGVK